MRTKQYSCFNRIDILPIIPFEVIQGLNAFWKRRKSIFWHRWINKDICAQFSILLLFSAKAARSAIHTAHTQIITARFATTCTSKTLCLGHITCHISFADALASVHVMRTQNNGGLNWVHVWTPSWPVHDLNILLVQKGCRATCCMGRGIVLDVHQVTPKHPPQDLDVPMPVHGSIHHHQLTPPHGGLHPIPWLTGHDFHH